MTTWLADTSVAVPMVQSAHAAHRRVKEFVGRRKVGLAAHSALETYSVLTRLPADARVLPGDASTLIATRFSRIVSLDPVRQGSLVAELAAAGIAGGAVYDALIGLTAQLHESTLLTRDSRAAGTYRVLGVDFEIVG